MIYKNRLKTKGIIEFITLSQNISFEIILHLDN